VTAPSTLRLFFHDCFVQVSVLCFWHYQCWRVCVCVVSGI
jgi:hypothetical protein